MTKCIGGPMHGKDVDCKSRYLVAPIYYTDRQPKRGRVINDEFERACIYELTRFSNGKSYYRLKQGYYNEVKK